VSIAAVAVLQLEPDGRLSFIRLLMELRTEPAPRTVATMHLGLRPSNE
jgi:hypothetical protein